MTISNEFKVGLTILLTAIIFFVGLRYLQDVPIFQSSTPLYTHLDNSSGLVPGNIVQVSGVKVGDVKGVTLAEDSRSVRVDFSVFDRVHLTEGSEVRISGIATLGGVRLAIVPGPADAEPLAAGSELPSRESRDVLGEISERAPSLLLRTDSLLIEATQSIRHAGDLFASSQPEIQATLATLRNSSEVINRALQIEEGRMDRLLMSAEMTTANVRDFTDIQGDSLAVTIAHLNSTMRRLDQFIERLDSSTSRVDQLLEDIETGQGSAGRFVTDPALHDQFEQTLIQLNEILEDLQRNPSRYLRGTSIIKLF